LTAARDPAVAVGMDEVADATTPPDGFAEMQRNGEYWRMSGPYFGRPHEGGAEQAFFAQAKHCNAQGFVHGGMLSAFLDGLLSQAVRLTTGDRSVVTIHLSVDFLAVAKAGEWVIGEGLVTRQTRDVIFVEGRIHSGGRDVSRGSGLFKPMRAAAS
jgi:uncharacterized protein (TIGR00369 family)